MKYYVYVLWSIFMAFSACSPIVGGGPPDPDYYQSIGNAYWSPDSKKVAFLYTNYSQEKQENIYHIVTYDIVNKEHKIVFSTPGATFLEGWRDDNTLLISQLFIDGYHYDNLSLSGKRDNILIRPDDKKETLHNAFPLPGSPFLLLSGHIEKKGTYILLFNADDRTLSPITFAFTTESISEKCGVYTLTQKSYDPLIGFKAQKIGSEWFMYFSNYSREYYSIDQTSICHFYGRLNSEKKIIENIILFDKEFNLVREDLGQGRLFMGWLTNQKFVYAREHEENGLKKSSYRAFEFPSGQSQEVLLPSIGRLSPDGQWILQERGGIFTLFSVATRLPQKSPNFYEILPKGDIKLPRGYVSP